MRGGKKIFIYCTYGSDSEMKNNKNLLVNVGKMGKFRKGELVYSDYGRPGRKLSEFLYEVIKTDIRSGNELLDDVFLGDLQHFEKTKIIDRIKAIFGGDSNAREKRIQSESNNQS